jgi:uncharacterized protein (TIGR02217 family)
MPVSFLEERFPPDISYGSKGGPSFNTTIFTAASGSEQRNSNWQVARCVYDVSHGIRDKADMDSVLNFFYNMRGKATGFRFKDWSDYHLTNGNIGTGNGTQTAYQIKKIYATGATVYERILRKIVSPTVGPPAVALLVKVNNVLLTNGVGYNINYNTGIITFTSAPAAGHSVVVSCEFDVPVRFDVDEMPITLEAFELETWDSIQLVELKLVV